ncbi:MAG: PQQ-like beta-propeller repeat protein [Chloroflexota bacterium]|nr:PQQ-like beta-propeller repeat protein [Chloroflexota bacterium]
MTTRSGIARLLALLLIFVVGMATPLAPSAAAQNEEEGLLSDTEYESPQFGYSVEWDEPWTALEDETSSSRSEGTDLLLLESDAANLQVFSTASGTTDAEEYLEITIESFSDTYEDLNVLDQSVSEELAAAVLEVTAQDGAPTYQFLEIRLVDGDEEYLISIDLNARVEYFHDELSGAQEAITLDGDQLFTALDLVELPDAQAREEDTETETEPETDAPQAADDVTPQYRGGVARTGEQPGPAPEGEPEVLWTFETDDDFGELSPAVSGDLIFFGPNALYGVEIETGDLDGSIEEDLGFVAPMATADGIVYATWEGGAVYALDPVAGEVVWTFETGDEALIGGAPAVSEGMVYLGTGNGDLFALDVESGEEVWTAEIGASFVAPAIVDGVLYIAAGEPATMYAFDAESGDELWSTEYADSTSYGALAVVDETIFVANGDGNLYALSTDEGEEIWVAELGNTTATGTPAVVDGVVYVVGGDGSLHAIAGTGERP